MNFLKKLAVIILSIILVMVIVSFFLPSRTLVERSAFINRNADVPFSLVNDVKQWNLWSPWYEMDTTTAYEYSEPTEGSGAWFKWKSNHSDVGYGMLTLTHSKPFDSIYTSLNFQDMGAEPGGFAFKNTGENQCEVTMFMDSEHGYNPINRWMGLMMSYFLGKDFQKAVDKLKVVSESIPEKTLIAGFESEFKDIPTIKVLGVRYQMKPSQIKSDIFAKSFERIGAAMAAQNLEPDGMPMSIYYEWGDKLVDFEAAMPVKYDAKIEGQVLMHELIGGKSLVVTYKGAYDKMTPVYQAAYDYILAQGMTQKGPVREIYITDPEEVKDTAQWITEIVLPIQ